MDASIRNLDVKAIAALSHPLRNRLIDLLVVDGPATASMLADRTDQNVGNVSHHMRVLADCALVEEAPELAKDKRERWWRVSTRRYGWSSNDLPDDPATQIVERAAVRTNTERQFRYLSQWEDDETQDRAFWPTGPFSSSVWLRMTDAELEQLSGEIGELLTRWYGREIPDDGQERRPVFAFAHGVPAQP